jgi:putative membrane protein
MKKYFLIAGLITITACKNTHKTDSKATVDTLNNMKDSVVDSSKSITKSLVMQVSHDDARFAVAAATGGKTEVELGRLATQNAGASAVKEFGSMMVKDHSAAGEKLKALAKAKGITLPDSLDESGFKIKARLLAKSGQDFDKAYVDDMIGDHQQDIKEFESAIPKLKDPELRAFAISTLPTLKMHLAAIQKIKQQMR